MVGLLRAMSAQPSRRAGWQQPRRCRLTTSARRGRGGQPFAAGGRRALAAKANADGLE